MPGALCPRLSFDDVPTFSYHQSENKSSKCLHAAISPFAPLALLQQHTYHETTPPISRRAVRHADRLLLASTFCGRKHSTENQENPAKTFARHRPLASPALATRIRACGSPVRLSVHQIASVQSIACSLPNRSSHQPMTCCARRIP